MSIYYNAAYTNTSNTAMPAYISETRSTAVLDNPEEWQLSVIRFDASTSAIPIALINNVAGGSGTDCYVTLSYLGVNYTQNVNLTKSQTTNFNFVYSYQHWLDDVNTAMAAAFVLMPPTGTDMAPVLIYDPVTELIRLYVSASYVQNVGNPITIGVNAPLYNYLRGFQAFFNGYGTANFIDYALTILPSNANVLGAPPPRPGLPASVQGALFTNVVSQETVTIGGWNPMRSLVLTSNLIPIRAEYIPTNVSQSSGNGPSSNYQPILTDFLADQSNDPINQRGTVVYLPTAQYRYADLLGNTPIFQLDFALSWTDFAGNVYPVLLGPGQTFGLKVLFEHKSEAHVAKHR